MAVDQGAKAYLEQLLGQWGLGSLADWAYRMLTEDRSEDEIIQLLRQRNEYKDRFKAIVQRVAAGLPALSEADVLNYENTARGLFRSSGLPPGFYDDPDDFVDLLVKDVSSAELQTRIEDGFVRVTSADPSIRAVFGEWFGASGDAALASIFLDPARALPALQRQVATAEIGGVSRNFGFGFSQGAAAGLAARLGGRTDIGGISQGFERLASVRPVFQETVSRRERGDDLLAEGAGADFAFGTGDGERVRARIRQRVSELSGGSGRVASSQRGLIGAGSAR